MNGSFFDVSTWLSFLSLPSVGLPSVFLISLVSATLLPMGSEPAVFAFTSANPHLFWLTIVVATLGNTIGGMINYGIGYSLHHKGEQYQNKAWFAWFKKMGAKSMFFSWLPAIGDPLCSVAGWLGFPFWRCVGWMILGKFLRYLIMTKILMLIPATFWQNLVFWS
jgi:membrane protein YqaA with SNARE-associated domain